MFIRVKSRATGHEFDLHESRFDEKRYTRVDKRIYPPTSKPRRTKFNARLARASFISADKAEEGVDDVTDDSTGR